MGRQFSLTVPLSPPRCITGHQWLLSCPGKALWRLTLSPTACIMALQGDYRLGCFLLRKPELRVSNSVWVHKDLLFHVINSYGCHKKPQVLKGSKKAEIFFFPSCQNSSLWKTIPCPIFGYICSMVATMDLCCLRKQQKENPDRERERVPMSSLLAIWRIGGENGPCWKALSIIYNIREPFTLGYWVWINIQ